MIRTGFFLADRRQSRPGTRRQYSDVCRAAAGDHAARSRPDRISELLLFNGIDGLFRVLVFVIFLYIVSWMKDMNRVFQYHGAEHKTVYNFEAREDLNVENARRYSTLHPRCGTSFLLVVMIVSILVFSIAHFDSFHRKAVVPHRAASVWLREFPTRSSATRQSIPQSLLRIVTSPGLLLQKITTKEPDDTQLEIAIRALEEALTV